MLLSASRYKAYEMQHTTKAWCTHTVQFKVITRKEGRLADSERVCACALWADVEKRIHNVG